ncbi:hypothetical protein BV25DRAFT_669548 [Artomyces pyxidatus]|uniref:Uncharacterized protein n=1 Tax=Artomyces pyxidatus TaxID=48021 RepID=A0ACB8T1F3_9AGAM|nr:hypothetical protein BV25DRAFT_669548 [Artomyces pyxidatus]
MWREDSVIASNRDKYRDKNADAPTTCCEIHGTSSTAAGTTLLTTFTSPSRLDSVTSLTLLDPCRSPLTATREMDSSAPNVVAFGTIISSLSGGAFAGTYALAKGRGQAVASVFAVSAALNCGIAGATFFGMREYAVKPAFTAMLPFKQYTRRRKQLNGSSTELQHRGDLTWWDIRTHCVLDSSVSGGITAGVINAWRRGSRGALRGLTIGACSCALIQLLCNEVEIQRVKYVSRSLQAASRPTQNSAPSAEPPKPTRSFGDRIMALFGLTRLTDEDYLAKLKQDRDKYLQRIAELEKLEVEQEKREP